MLHTTLITKNEVKSTEKVNFVIHKVRIIVFITVLLKVYMSNKYHIKQNTDSKRCKMMSIATFVNRSH